MMHVVFLANRFDSSSRGGVENYLLAASRWYAKNGCKVTVVARKWSPEDLSEEEAGGIRVRRIPPPAISGLSLILKPVKTERHFRRCLSPVLDAEKPDCIITRTPFWAVSALKLGCRCPVIFIPSSVDRLIEHAGKRAVSLKKKCFHGLWQAQISSLEKFALTRATHAVIFSETIRKQFHRLYRIGPEALRIIPPGVDANRFCPDGDRSIRESCGIERDETVVLSVCRLSPEKSLNTVIAAMEGAGKWRWVIVGDGPERERLEALSSSLEGRVILAGASDSPERWYRAADVFLLPSVYETFGQVLLEAMACGLPCVARRPCPPDIDTASAEIIDHNETGLLADGLEAGSLIESVNFLAENKTVGKEFGENGRKKVLNEFCWERHFEKLISLAE